MVPYSKFTKHTGHIFSELKLFKFKDIFLINQTTFHVQFYHWKSSWRTKNNFVINRSIHSYETRYSMVFHLPKAKTSCFGSNTLRYDGANLCNKFYHALLYKEPNLTKEKLKNYFKCISWTLVLDRFSSHYFFQFYCSQNKIINRKFKEWKFWWPFLVLPCVLLGLLPQPLI